MQSMQEIEPRLQGLFGHFLNQTNKQNMKGVSLLHIFILSLSATLGPGELRVFGRI